jgi:hypothetical protein
LYGLQTTYQGDYCVSCREPFDASVLGTHDWFITATIKNEQYQYINKLQIVKQCVNLIKI